MTSTDEQEVRPRLSPGELYVDARRRFEEFVRPLPSEVLDSVVPATPLWTALQVVAHEVGVCEDMSQQRSPDERGFDPWTAEQVERRQGWDLDRLFAAWDAVELPLVALLDQGVSWHMPMIADVVTHEQDLRGLAALPGGRESPAYRFTFASFRARFLAAIRSSDFPDLRLITEDGEWSSAGNRAEVTLGVNSFEFCRGVMGRRSPRQMIDWNWSCDPTPYLPLLVVFGPRQDDLIEA